MNYPINKPILLSSPHLGDRELHYVQEAFATNWIAPLGPNVDAFEQSFCDRLGSGAAAALSSGTAAIHLALQLLNVEMGDEVFCSTLTFAATANPICYLKAKPVFIDSDRQTWNMDPEVFHDALMQRVKRNKRPKAVVLVHLYGQSADMAPILDLCEQYEIPLIEDAAEALGATYRNIPVGTLGKLGVFSFNGNKIITTSGGGMLVSDDEIMIEKSRFLATQARDPAPHYQHSHIGYNYRMSNVLAGIGRGQLEVLDDRIAARRHHFECYEKHLGHLPGLTFMPEETFGGTSRANRWLTALTIDERGFGCDRETLRQALAAQRIESRPVWKPLHLQPIFSGCDYFGGQVSEDLFRRGLCLPSGSNLTTAERDRVIQCIQQVHARYANATQPRMLVRSA